MPAEEKEKQSKHSQPPVFAVKEEYRQAAGEYFGALGTLMSRQRMAICQLTKTPQEARDVGLVIETLKRLGDLVEDHVYASDLLVIQYRKRYKKKHDAVETVTSMVLLRDRRCKEVVLNVIENSPNDIEISLGEKKQHLSGSSDMRERLLLGYNPETGKFRRKEPSKGMEKVYENDFFHKASAGYGLDTSFVQTAKGESRDLESELPVLSKRLYVAAKILHARLTNPDNNAQDRNPDEIRGARMIGSVFGAYIERMPSVLSYHRLRMKVPPEHGDSQTVKIREGFFSSLKSSKIPGRVDIYELIDPDTGKNSQYAIIRAYERLESGEMKLLTNELISLEPRKDKRERWNKKKESRGTARLRRTGKLTTGELPA